MTRGLSIIFLAVWPGSCLFSQIVLNEILFDPAGAESTDEFIEILNTYPSDTVDLSGWKVGEKSLDRLRDAGEGLLLPPGAFGVIVDPDNLELASGYRERIPDSAVLLTVESKTLGNAGLSNSEPETIRLVNQQDSCVSICRYHIGNEHGFSDEKIDPFGLDSPSNWMDGIVWGGTPGAANSVSNVPIRSETALDVSPNPFSPDGDGFQDLTGLTYNLPAGAYDLSMRIFDIRGRCIKTLMSGSPSGPQETVIWDGRDDDGRTAGIGLYICHLEAVNRSTLAIHRAVAVTALAGRL